MRSSRKLPLVRHYLLLTNYTEDKVHRQAAGPSHACFLDPSTLKSLAHKLPLVQDLEGQLRGIRTTYMGGPSRKWLARCELASTCRCSLT